MASTFDATGADQLERLARRLNEAGDRELRKELLAGIRKTNKPIIAKIRESAGDLPAGGNLAGVVAKSKIGTRVRLSGKSVGVEIKATGKHNLKRMNAGQVRHPLYGNREHWYTQQIKPGFFDDPIKRQLPTIRAGIQHSMGDVARKIQRGV